MSYATGQTLALTLLRTLSGFTAANTDEDDWQKLSKGGSDHFAFLREGPLTVAPAGYGGLHEWRYRTIIEVWQRYKNSDLTTSKASLNTHVRTVMAGFLPERLLNQSSGNIIDATIAGAGEPLQVPADNPTWLKREVYLDWIEQEKFSYTD